MRSIPLIVLVSGTAVLVATAPYMITQTPDAAPAPARAPDLLPDRAPAPETDSANEAAPGRVGARVDAAGPARRRDRSPASAPRRGSASDPAAPAPVVAAPAPGSPSRPGKTQPGKTQPGKTRPSRPDPGKPKPDPATKPDPNTGHNPTTPPGPGTNPRPPAGHDPEPEPHPGLLNAPDPEGGETIFARGGVRCTLGFNVRRSGSYYFLTAGGCAEVGLKLYADPTLVIELGTVVAVRNSTALVRYVSPRVERPGSVGTPSGSQDVMAARGLDVGRRVCRTGPDIGIKCGTVTALDQSVRLRGGTIRGLVKTTICTENGDAPGTPYLSGPFAVGMGIGAAGNCDDGGSFIQPLGEVLSAFDAEIY
ncbi:S1 family peptidase [Actinomadura chibensis]|uniref:Streptogrisin B n=1 Tax=Actinomadura chibensis TaxID=392828 RepID=A0A5D0NUT7_9ACTN|nr:S1 family peptidase [Actinomadura chibensis]TYB47948.1 hypothetical protein FXF69_01515 [Actinomadura chibensis]